MTESAPTSSKTLLKQMTASDRYPRGIVGDPGFKLLGTPLGFSGSSRPGLLFFGNIDDPLPVGSQRCIGAMSLFNWLGHRRKNIEALPMDYYRVFRLGRMEMRLLPAGMGPGSALLEIKHSQRTILYCGRLRVDSSADMEPAVPVPCDLLLVDYAASDVSPTLSFSAGRLKQWLSRRKNISLADAIVCHSLTATMDVLHLLRDSVGPIAASRTLYESLRDLNLLGAIATGITRLGGHWPTSGLVLLGASAFQKRHAGFQNLHGETIRTLLAGSGFRGVSARRNFLSVGEAASLPQLLSFARATGAATVALTPKCGPVVASAFEKAGFAVHLFHPPAQLPLPHSARFAIQNTEPLSPSKPFSKKPMSTDSPGR